MAPVWASEESMASMTKSEICMWLGMHAELILRSVGFSPG
jgi:hypothetical protein